MNIDYSKLSEILFQLLMAVLVPVAGFAAAWLKAKYSTERSNLDSQNKWLLDQGVNIAIYAAEQIYGAGKGAEKKAYALDIAEKWLAQYKINIDLDVVEAAIEAAVKTQFDSALAQASE